MITQLPEVGHKLDQDQWPVWISGNHHWTAAQRFCKFLPVGIVGLGSRGSRQDIRLLLVAYCFTFFIPPSDYSLSLPTVAPSSIIFNNLCIFPGGSDGKASACNAGDPDSIPGLGISPGEGNGNPLQYPYLENPMDGGACQATVHGGHKESDMT